MLEEKIKLLLESAVLAPSSHNIQPWLFKIEPDYIDLYADLKRKLKEGDKQGRMIFVSLGCLIANLKIAASHFGLSCRIDYRPALNSSFVARIKLENDLSSLEDRYFEAIFQRRSNRNKYQNKRISDSDLRDLANLNKRNDLKIDFIADSSLKSQIAEISGWAMGQIMSDKNFRKELAGWLRTNLTLKKDGMPGSGHGMSLPLSFIAPFILRHINVSKVEAKKEKKRILNFPVAGIISSTKDSPVSWLFAGELLETVLLAAQIKSIDSVIRVVSIEIPEARAKLGFALGLHDFYPQMLFGLGYAEKKAPHSSRRPIKDLIIH